MPQEVYGPPAPVGINWSDPKAKISPNFTVREALLLPSWGVMHEPSEHEKENILLTAQKMELIREFLDKPVHVTCWLRPTFTRCDKEYYSGKNYNQLIGGAPNSAHTLGLAVDFQVSTITADDVRYLLQPKLEEFQIRMENHNGNWTHIDLRPVPKGGRRFFRP